MKEKTGQIFDEHQEILKYAFGGELISSMPPKYHPITTIDELSEKINEYLLGDISCFENAYRDLKILKHLLTGNIFKLNYFLGSRNYDAYAFYLPQKEQKNSTLNASLIIPGSGHNQGTEIFYKNKSNYQGNIAGITEMLSDTYILVKPNEDFAALHNGRKKLNYEFVHAYLLNKGGAYSSRYIVDSLALIKFFKKKYGKVFILGLSQGGHAALLNSLQSEPAAAVVAEGFSILFDKIYFANLGQIVIPGADINNIEKIYSKIKNQKTNYLFTFGKRDTDYYKVESEKGYTKEYFKKLANVEVIEHGGGHNYPLGIVKEFLSNLITPDKK